MNFLKRYFDTPKMPLRFYFDGGIAFLLFWFLLFNGITMKNNIILGILIVLWFALGIYSYAWLRDYMVTTHPNSKIIFIFFGRYSIFNRRSVGAYVATSYLTRSYEINPKYDGTGGYRVTSDFASSLKTGFIIGFFIRLITLMPASFIISFSPFFHISTMKKLRTLFDIPSSTQPQPSVDELMHQVDVIVGREEHSPED